jgi:peptide/nickel transport system permease protein
MVSTLYSVHWEREVEMLAYIVRRLSYTLVLLVLLSFVSFIIINLPPGDYLTFKLADLQARGDRSAQDRIDEYRARYGLDEPFLAQYFNWITNFVKGDFGESFQYERPVADLLGQRILLTTILAIASLTVVWLIAIPVGVYSATHQYSLGDQIITTISFIGLGTPSFVLALIVLFIVVVILGQDAIGLFSREFQDAPWSLAKVVDLFKHLWIPAFIGAFTGTASLIRIMRGNLLDTLGQPFVEAARARGLKNRTVIWRHAVRIAINPLIVILGTEALPGIIGGNALMEIVLNLPTLGPLWLEALTRQDMYMAGTGIVFFSLFIMLGNLLADVLLSVADPRIRLD